jgi:hypothetical protein
LLPFLWASKEKEEQNQWNQFGYGEFINAEKKIKKEI